MIGIMLLDGLDEPAQAFVVAQDRNVAGHNRRRCLEGVLDIGHLITFLANPALRRLRLECADLAVNSRPGRSRNRVTRQRPTGFAKAIDHPAVHRMVKNRRQIVAAKGFPPRSRAHPSRSKNRPFGPLQARKALLYAARSRTIVSPVPR